MYIREIQVRSRNHCFREKAISIKYSVCVFVTSLTQHAMRMRHTAICCLPRSTFSHIISQTVRFSEKRKVIVHKMCVFIFSICILDKKDEYTRSWPLHVQRMPLNRMPLKSYQYRPQGRRTTGRPKKRWREQL